MFLEMLRRVLIGSSVPSTEIIQKQILNHLDGHGPCSAHFLYDVTEASSSGACSNLIVDQAAQILVNKGYVISRYQGSAVDPVNARGRYELCTVPHRHS